MMKKLILTSTLIMTVLAVNIGYACQPQALNSCRDYQSKYLSKRKIRKSKKLFKKYPHLKEDFAEIFKTIDYKVTGQELFDKFSTIPYIKDKFNKCDQFLSEEYDDSKEVCLNFIVEDSVYLSYIQGFLDETASIILLSKFKGKKKKQYTGKLDSYAKKIRLLRKKLIKNQGEEALLAKSALNNKKYYQKHGGYKKLAPKQKLLLKYSYTQIKKMGEILIKLDKRVKAQSAGLFYDFDGDGVYEDIYLLDQAEQYRMSVKLLNLELAKESTASGIFQGQRPSYMDLLAASEELGLIGSEQLALMIEMPYLYKKKIPGWKKFLKILGRISKNVVMAIPGINLYAIVPVVVVETYFESRKARRKISDDHLFTF